MSLRLLFSKRSQTQFHFSAFSIIANFGKFMTICRDLQ